MEERSIFVGSGKAHVARSSLRIMLLFLPFQSGT